MRNFLKAICIPALLSTTSHGAISIFIEPNPADPGTTLLTLTQTSPSPTLSVSNVVGYSFGMSLPTSMFKIAGSGSSTGIPLSHSPATVTDGFSGETFLLTQLLISADPAAPSRLEFDRLYTTPASATTLRFEAISAGPVATSISPGSLNAGDHTVTDTLFGTVTVTVIPEPAVPALLATTLLPFLICRRTRSLSTHE